ncbi:hypothetical protein [Stenomitos frigidus]|uniref:hypothetical protein n=1 Tax=Stenomitos frigidus TaxID=1886765 RepID=UPI0015E76A7E|nr:hypothetical protein [Stenomitos frigidus]
MASCPLCSDILLRHIRSGKSYWLCRRCRLEILEKSDPTCNASSLPPPQVSVEWLPTLQAEISNRHSKPHPQITTEV